MGGETTKTNVAKMVKEILSKYCITNWYEDTYNEIVRNPFKTCQALVECIHELQKENANLIKQINEMNGCEE